MEQAKGNLYEEIVRSMDEGVMVIGMDGQILMLNPAAESMLGLTKDDIGKAYMAIFLMQEENDSFNEIILDTIYNKKKMDGTPVDFVRDGERLNLVLTTSYILNEGQSAVVVVMNDVTRLNELRHAQVALEAEKRANESKSQFLSNMSHEIRTPINAVLGMNEMILREAQDSQILTYAANIQSSGKTLLFLINDILDMSKIESGKMEIIPVNYEISAVIMDLWNIIHLRAKEKNLKLGVGLDETLPSVLYGDDVRIKQIVTNLLTNAVKYTPKGSVWMNVAYERQNDDGMLLKISVKDTGMGIRQEDMGKLFESFQRLDEEKNRNIEGTGLGMNITMSLLKMMGGEMKVESEYGKGSTFTVIIPQKIINNEPTGSFQSIQEKNKRWTNSSQGNFIAPEGCILVVDDNAMNLTVVKALLKRTKLQVVTADSGEECLEYMQKQKFHIVFMDHMMPEMDGIETLHEIKKLAGNEDFLNKSTPVIALTANAVAGAREMYLAEGFADFLTKPINAEAMERMICGYLPKELVKTGGADETGPAESGGDPAYDLTAPEGRVIVVDDDAMNLAVFKALLKRTKLQVVTASSGKQSLEWVRRQKFHIIFMDHMMPEMDGIETLHEIKRLAADGDFPNRDTPVIALTANYVKGAREMYQAEGFSDFLIKPADVESMGKILRGYLPKELLATGGADGEGSGGGDDEYGVYLEQGVSVKNGLHNAQGDMETYMELVRMFVKDRAKIGQLRQYISGHNMKDYAIQVHALKGNARTLGADRLADIAFEHETQSKAGNEGFVTANWDGLEKAWNSVLGTFEAIYEKYGPKQEEADVSQDGEALELSQEQLDGVAALIDDFKSDEALEQIKEWLKSPLAPDMRQRLKDAVSAIEDDFDEDSAIEILKS